MNYLLLPNNLPQNVAAWENKYLPIIHKYYNLTATQVLSFLVPQFSVSHKAAIKMLSPQGPAAHVALGRTQILIVPWTQGLSLVLANG